jgi:hypothetical protein
MTASAATFTRQGMEYMVPAYTLRLRRLSGSDNAPVSKSLLHINIDEPCLGENRGELAA